MKKVISAALALIMSTGLIAVAQEIPQPQELQARVIDQIPGFWSITEFRVISSAKVGDPITPKALLRFEADAGPIKDLYKSTGEEVGPFEVVVKTFEAAGTRTLFGTMELSYRAGEWSGDANLENSVTDLGAPIDYFNRPVIELGSDEQARILELLRSDAIDRTRRAIEQDQRVLTAQHEGAMAALKLEHEQALAAQKRTYQAQLSANEAEYEPAIAAEEARLATEREELQAEQQKETDVLAAAHQNKMEELKTAHARARGDLIARQTEEFATLETGLAAKKKALEERIAAADELIKMQEALIAKNEEIADNDTWIEQMSKVEVKNRNELFESLLGGYSGSVQCADRIVNIKFNMSKYSVTGISGSYVDNDVTKNSVPSQLIMTSKTVAYPMKFNLNSVGRKSTGLEIPYGYAVSLSEFGVFTGKSLTEDPRNRGKYCEIQFSR